MCGMRPSADNTNNLCLLFINNIQLAKFHNKIVGIPAAAQQPQADTTRILKPDSVQYDSLRRPMPHPSNRPMTVGEMNKLRQGHQIKQNLKPNN